MKNPSLFHAIWNYFSPPVFDGDEEKTRVARVLNAILLSYDLMLVLAIVADAFIYINKGLNLVFIGVGLVLVYVTREVMRRGFVRLAGIIGTISQWLVFTVLIALSGGMSSITVVFYLAGTVVSGLMLGPLAAGLYSLMGIVGGLIMTLLDASGYALPRIFSLPARAGLVDLALTLVLTTMAVNITLVSLKDALRRARKELKERQTVENELRLSENRYRALFETAGNPILLMDTASMKIIDANEAASLLYGYSLEEFLHLGIKDLAPQQEMIYPGTYPPHHAFHHKKGGMVFPVEMTTGAFTLANRKILVGFITDIGVRRQREAEMEAIVEIGAAMRHAPNRSELLTIILRQVTEMLGAEGTVLVVSDPYTQELVAELGCGRFEAVTGRRASTSLDLHALAAIQGLAGTDISSPAGALFSDLAIPDAVPNVACSLLINQNETLGALLVGHSKAMTVEQYRLLTTISEIAASALKRITLFEATTTYAHQMATAGEMGLLLAQTLDLPTLYTQAGQYVTALLPDVAALIVSLFDSTRQRFTCVYALADGEEMDITSLPPLPLEAPGYGIQSQVVHTRRPMIVPDLQASRNHVVKSMVVGDPARVTRSALLVPMLAHDNVLGVINLQSYTLNRFTQKDTELLTLVSNTIAVAIENASLFNGLQQSNLELSVAYDATISGWSRALDLRDMETEGHSQRVADLTVRLGHDLGLGEKELVQLRRGALLHDIGKIGIPDGILLKPEPLNAEEWQRMRLHPVYAYDMLRPIEFLRDALEIPYAHHEKWNGSGYPRGLQGEQIPLAARIFAVVDVWDALTTDRPYRGRWSREKAREYIQSQAGQHFDPVVVEAFKKLLNESPLDGLHG